MSFSVNEVLAMRGRILPDEHILINSTLQLIGRCLMGQRKLQAAEKFLSGSFELRQRTLPNVHWLTPTAKSILGECLTLQNRFDEAEILLLESYQTLKKELGENHEQPPKNLRRIAKLKELKN